MSLRHHLQLIKKIRAQDLAVGIYEAGPANPNVVVCAVTWLILKLEKFIEDFPNAFVQTGIAEANMIGIAAGLTIGGKFRWQPPFANFGTGRIWPDSSECSVFW